MLLTFISDLHTKHPGVIINKTDMLICTGDISNMGRLPELLDFVSWFDKQPATYLVLTAGNHECDLEQNYEKYKEQMLSVCSRLIMLNEEEVTIEGIKIYGSPITPNFNGWSWNRARGEEIKKHWDKIPQDTQLLLTHGPAYGILDKVLDTREPQGCEELLKAVNRIKPKIHAFGHLHEGYGMLKVGDTTHINSSQLNDRYQLVNKPIQVTWEDL